MPVMRLLLALSLVAPAIGRAQSPKVHDSAGVRIVENQARSSAPVTFAMEKAPSFDIGGLKDTPDDEFNQNAGNDMLVKFSDGTFVMNDFTRLRFFDAAGKQTRVVGRSGSGPLEFKFARSICVTRGDTLVIWDPINSRLTWISRPGDLVRTTPLARVDVGPQFCLGGDGLVLGETDRSGAQRGEKFQISAAGESGGSTLGVFSSDAIAAARGNRVFVADPDRYDINVFDERGRLVQVIRTNDRVAIVTASERIARERANYPVRPTWPTLSDIIVDPGGRLWVSDAQRPDDSVRRWTAFDRNGLLLGALEFPAWKKLGDAVIKGFLEDGVIVLNRDSDGAAHLRVFRLKRLKG